MSPTLIDRLMTVPAVVELFGGEARQLVLMSGIPASGKSFIGLMLRALGFDYHNADSIRGELYGDEAILGDTKKVFGILRERLRATLARGGKAVVDVTNVTRRNRQEFLDLVREFNYPPAIVLMMDVAVSTCLARNKIRDRHVPEHVIMSMVTSMVRSGLPTSAEGQVLFLRPAATRGEYQVLNLEAVANEPLPANVHAADMPVSQLMKLMKLPGPSEKMDIIGDVHGCFNELVTLIGKLGHTLTFERSRRNGVKVKEFKAKDGRKLGFVGDLVDRGPGSDRVLALVRWLVNHNHAVVVAGNHDDRLLRLLDGKRVRVAGSLKTSVAQLKSRPTQFRCKVRSFLLDLPLVHESSSLVLVHAAYRSGKVGNEFRQLALYGEIDDSKRDAKGRHVRQTLWEDEYAGTKTIVRGHDAVLHPRLSLSRNGGWTVNIDTGCCFGNALTAFRFPEMYFISVPAEKVHWKSDFKLQ